MSTLATCWQHDVNCLSKLCQHYRKLSIIVKKFQPFPTLLHLAHILCQFLIFLREKIFFPLKLVWSFGQAEYTGRWISEEGLSTLSRPLERLWWVKRWNLSPQTVTNGSTTDIISWRLGKSSCVRPTRDASRRVIIGCLWPIGTFFKATVRQPKQTVGFFRLERWKHIPVTTIMVFWAQLVKCWWYGKTPSLQSYAYFSSPFSLIMFSYEKIPCLPKMSSFSLSVILLFSLGFCL